jgi:hypothetical protein
MKSVSCTKPDYTTCSNIPYNLIFTTKLNDSSILITHSFTFKIKIFEQLKVYN